MPNFEVRLRGFRSYRDAVVSEFSPRHNVIVGRNGSGKSNFFFAVEFILSDEFTPLCSKYRRGLIHEGVGEKVSTAQVEIIFDNTDRRFVAVSRQLLVLSNDFVSLKEGASGDEERGREERQHCGSEVSRMDFDEVIVGRRVSPIKDQFFINSKTACRADVVDLMASARLSRCNPYHIVKQGKINELAVSSDAERLKLLKEVAGARIYDVKREENLTAFRQADVSCEKIEILRAAIEERLQTLKQEKDDAKEFRKWDKVKRAVEYTIYDNQLKEINKKLAALEMWKDEMKAQHNGVSSTPGYAHNTFAPCL
ncbi:unnamed protein product [Toxocara canis]|uniref:SMC_N domain-containing protein n=1 Tax=Toxocara canis TaxID=6265 RepID=A0A183VDU3_TOXCA|nr:unnamed protein product [Toxocara canis]